MIRMIHPIDEKRSQLEDLCRQAGVLRLDAFGSVVRGDFDPSSSDLDFIVEFGELPPVAYARAWFALKEGLEDLFKRPVDLITPSSLSNPYFRRRVEAERLTVYAS